MKRDIITFLILIFISYLVYILFYEGTKSVEKFTEKEKSTNINYRPQMHKINEDGTCMEGYEKVSSKICAVPCKSGYYYDEKLGVCTPLTLAKQHMK